MITTFLYYYLLLLIIICTSDITRVVTKLFCFFILFYFILPICLVQSISIIVIDIDFCSLLFYRVCLCFVEHKITWNNNSWGSHAILFFAIVYSISLSFCAHFVRFRCVLLRNLLFSLGLSRISFRKPKCRNVMMESIWEHPLPYGQRRWKWYPYVDSRSCRISIRICGTWWNYYIIIVNISFNLFDLRVSLFLFWIRKWLGSNLF